MEYLNYAQLNEAYYNGVYSQQEPLNLQEWLEDLTNQGYNLDDYSDEELYEAYLENLNEGWRPAKRFHDTFVKKEELDLFDVVLDHLISEGFCNTVDAATVVMANMSEEWRDDILDEVTGWGRIRFRKGLPGRKPKKAGMGKTPQEKAAYVFGTVDTKLSKETDPEKEARLRARRERLAPVALR